MGPNSIIEIDSLNIEAQYIEFLRARGYLVVGPRKSRDKLKSIKDIIEYFYNKCYLAYNDIEMYTLRDPIRDKASLNGFINELISLGYSKKTAMTAVLDYIDDLFKYEDYLGLGRKISNLTVFSAECRWILNKISAVRDQVAKNSEEEFQQQTQGDVTDFRNQNYGKVLIKKAIRLGLVDNPAH